jgi:hypothetical protein
MNDDNELIRPESPQPLSFPPRQQASSSFEADKQILWSVNNEH